MFEDSFSSDDEPMVIVDPDDVSPCQFEISEPDYMQENPISNSVHSAEFESYEIVLDQLLHLLPDTFSYYNDSSDHQLAGLLSGTIDYIAFLQSLRDSLSDSSFDSSTENESLPESPYLHNNNGVMQPHTKQENILCSAVESLNGHGDGKSVGGDSKLSSSSAEPRRPKNGFIRFSIEQRKWLSRDHPKLDNREISRMLGTKWRKMSANDRKPYEAEFNEDLKVLREKFPGWRYAPVRGNQQLAEPMPTRLRDRHSLKRKIPPVIEMLGKRKSSNRKKRVTQSGCDLWVKCCVCGKWRKLAPTADRACLPLFWYCELNPDFRFNSCSIEQQRSVPNSPEADDFLSAI